MARFNQNLIMKMPLNITNKLKNLKIKRVQFLSKILKNKKKCFIDHYLITSAWAHKVVKILWELHYGKQFPKNMQANHTCDNAFCINIFHIFIGTHKDNMQDKVNKGRANNVKGENCYNAKLTESEVLKIRSLYASNNYTYEKLGSMFKVTSSNIISIIKKETWKHI